MKKILSLKIGLPVVLLVLLIFGSGILFVRIRFSPEQTEIPAKVPDSPPATENKAADERLIHAVHDKKLQAQTDALLTLFDQMPTVPVYLKDEPILESGTNTETGNAYTHCDNHKYPLIFVKQIYYRTADSKRLTNTLKHELTHAWLCRQNLMAEGHGVDFRRKFKSVGGWGIGIE